MNRSETIKVIPARYPLRAVGAVAALLVLAVVVQSAAFNPRWIGRFSLAGSLTRLSWKDWDKRCC